MKAINIEDFRTAAKRRLPKIFFDYIDGGAFSESTMRSNRSDLESLRLRQRVLVGGATSDLRTTFFGRRQVLPFMIGPVGFLGLYAGDGERKAVRAAHDAGIAFCLSTFSIASIAELRAGTKGPLHFQLYVLNDRGLTSEFIAEAKATDVDTLYVTVDTAITSVRERDVRNGFRSLTRLTPKLMLSMAMRPHWLVDMARSGTPSVRAVAHRPEFGRGAMENAAQLSKRIDQGLSWKDVAWLRENWSGRLAVKGVMDAQDAVRAKECGADDVIVSNHGGRQLDGGNSTIAALSAIRDAVGPDFGVMIDSGFRRGTDIVKALALGADGVLLGRAYAFALAAAGQAGVSTAITLLAEEIRITLALMGLTSIDELKEKGRHCIVHN